MFPWQYAKAGAQRLAQAGADVTLRIVPDLYHAYPGEQNDGLLNWFDPGLALSP
jgi:dienelactone hydrolase